MAGAVGDRYTVMGDAVNVAARLQAAGRPNSVTVGESTYRSTRETIQYERLEPLTLKGKEEPVPAWEATAVLAGPKTAAARSQTPLIGREDEAGLLTSMAERIRPRGPTAPGHGDRAGGRRQVAAAARTDDEPRRQRAPSHHPTRPTPPYGAGIAYWALSQVLREEFEILDTGLAQVAGNSARGGRKADGGARGAGRGRAERRPPGEGWGRFVISCRPTNSTMRISGNGRGRFPKRFRGHHHVCANGHGPGTWISTSQETSTPVRPKSGAGKSTNYFFPAAISRSSFSSTRLQGL